MKYFDDYRRFQTILTIFSGVISLIYFIVVDKNIMTYILLVQFGVLLGELIHSGSHVYTVIHTFYGSNSKIIEYESYLVLAETKEEALFLAKTSRLSSGLEGEWNCYITIWTLQSKYEKSKILMKGEKNVF